MLIICKVIQSTLQESKGKEIKNTLERGSNSKNKTSQTGDNKAADCNNRNSAKRHCDSTSLPLNGLKQVGSHVSAIHQGKTTKL